MPSRYEGTPLESDYDRLKRRRALNAALVKQSMAPYQGTEMVSGHAVDDRWGQGLGKIGQAIVGAMSNRKADKDAASLNTQYDEGRQKAMDKVMSALSTTGPYGPQKPDPMKAALGMTDPYLDNDKVATAMINAQAYGGRSGGYPSYQFLPTAKGYARGNRRTGDIEQVEGDFIRSQDDVDLQTDLGYGRSYGAGKGGGTADIDPTTGKGAVQTDVSQAKADVDIVMQPPIAAAKADAEAEQKRAFTMQGANAQIDRAEELLRGTGKERPTGSWVGSVMDMAGSLIGMDVSGSVQAERLKTIGAGLTGKTPRFEGPQSDHDIALYEKMAGSVGNQNISPEKRMAAVEEFRAAFAKYEEVSPGRFVAKSSARKGGLTSAEEAELKALEAEFGAQ